MKIVPMRRRFLALQALLDDMTLEERVEFHADLRARYCMGCWQHQPYDGPRCQCENDE